MTFIVFFTAIVFNRNKRRHYAFIVVVLLKLPTFQARRITANAVIV